MPANVTSNPFTDDRVLFANKTAANVWRTSLVVPDATVGTKGVVSAAANVVVSDIVIVNEDGSTTPLPLNTLADALIAAGLMAPAV